MDCPEIRRVFVDGRVPEGPAVQQHLASCEACRELFQAEARLGQKLAQGVTDAPDSAQLLVSLERQLAAEVGLRAQLRAWPTSWRAATLVVASTALMASQLWLRRRPDFALYSGEVFWGVALLLLVVLGLAARSWLRGATQPSSPAARRQALVVLALPVLVVLIVPLGAPAVGSAAWGSPGACFSYGALLVVPFLALSWLFERRDALPLTALASTGALAGLSANLLLHAHCPSQHLGHLLLGHASIGAAWALGLTLFASLRRRSS